MKFSWINEADEELLLRTFLKKQGVSRNLLAKIKFQGGRLAVNGVPVTVRHVVQKEDVVEVELPAEGEHETLLRDPTPLDIVYEDEHYLIVNKPAYTASIPAQYHPNQTMANRVKNYYCEQGYDDQVVHVITRLDRDTTGLMLFAKHSFAHGLLAKEMQTKQMVKQYQGIVHGEVAQLAEHGEITGPIAREPGSILKRRVDPAGQPAQTEYWLTERFPERYCALVTMQLHTGKTHQIRVHFSSAGCPLVGDELYGGSLDYGIERQALHCVSLAFSHPFTHEWVHVQQELPADMLAVLRSFEMS